MAKGPTKRQGTPRTKGGPVVMKHGSWAARIALGEMKQKKSIRISAARLK